MAAWRVRARRAGLEESLWLCPIEDRRRLDSCREGMLEGFSLGSYFLLVDYTGRLYRKGKAAISAELAGILDRLGSHAESWRARLDKLRSGRLFGRFFAASRERMREVAERLDVRRVAKLAGCPTRGCELEPWPASTTNDPDLASVIDPWDRLPEAVRRHRGDGQGRR